MLMVWIGVGIAVALVLLIVVRAMMGGEKPAPASGPAGKVDRPSAPSKPPSTGKAGKKGDDDQEPEGTKVASVPPPAVGKAQVKDVVKEEQKLRASEGRSTPEITVEASFEEEDDMTGPIPLILVTGVGRTDPGRRRKHNEDAYLALPDHNLFVIADGMGGYAAGEVASALATEVISEAFKTATFVGETDPMRPARGDELVRAIQMANEAILTQARANEAQHGMGTTLVSIRFSPNKQRAYIAHVGDSRCYRLRDGEIRQMTMDHTLGAVGITGPAASKLSRAVGIAESVEVDLLIDHPTVGDLYLLCCDGLNKMVPDSLIRDVVCKDGDLDRAVNELVDTANERGGRDNITVILIRVEQPKL